MRMNTKVYFLLFATVLGALSACSRHPPGVGKPVAWSELVDWDKDQHHEAWPALLQTCQTLPRSDATWKPLCAQAKQIPTPTAAQAKLFFETWFQPHAVYNDKNGREGKFTGYYNPLIEGSRLASAEYPHPLYARPKDLLEIDLTSLYPQLKGMRLRGRVQGNKVIPYFSSQQINAGASPFKGEVLFWIKNPIDLFFLHIQGSGKIKLPDNTIIPVGYHDQNGHPYVAIGGVLKRLGELKDPVNMQSIRDWFKRYPQRIPEILAQNPSFVFFRLQDPPHPEPLGSLGVPLTPERSVAVDRKHISLGLPLWIETDLPDALQKTPWRRLVFAQDTGGAIGGPVRVDFYWGSGERATYMAGNMNQKGRVYVLLPKSVVRN